ncbi:hypothetical protein AB0875_07105 [Micromonospora gifhornensis]|uniref:hypothetical protein n=1 Tax=Micromonospora gifhornensis TaxID=84594 RepID=UPI003451F459
MNYSSSALVKVAVLVASGIAINKISDLFDITAPFILIGSAAILAAMFLLEAGTGSTKDAKTNRMRSDPNINLVKFCLATMLLGATIQGVAMIPLFEDRVLTAPIYTLDGMSQHFHLYELGAITTITLLAVVPAVRRQDPIQVLAFLVSAVTGMTLTLVAWPRPNEQIFITETFFGWLTASVAVTFFIRELPNIIHLYSGFWFTSRDERARRTPRANTTEDTNRSEDRSNAEPRTAGRESNHSASNIDAPKESSTT